MNPRPILVPISLSTDRDRSRPLASESAGELEIFRLDGDALGVDRREVGVLELFSPHQRLCK